MCREKLQPGIAKIVGVDEFGVELVGTAFNSQSSHSVDAIASIYDYTTSPTEVILLVGNSTQIQKARLYLEKSSVEIFSIALDRYVRPSDKGNYLVLADRSPKGLRDLVTILIDPLMYDGAVGGDVADLRQMNGLVYSALAEGRDLGAVTEEASKAIVGLVPSNKVTAGLVYVQGHDLSLAEINHAVTTVISRFDDDVDFLFLDASNIPCPNEFKVSLAVTSKVP